jgi:hypothetical protein
MGSGIAALAAEWNQLRKYSVIQCELACGNEWCDDRRSMRPSFATLQNPS